MRFGKDYGTSLQLAFALMYSADLTLKDNVIIVKYPNDKIHWYVFSSKEYAQDIFEKTTEYLAKVSKKGQ